MAESVNLTIRVAEDLKAAVERAAGTTGQTTTEYLLQSARLRMAAACAACGRDLAGPPTVLPGMSSRFEEWCNSVVVGKGSSPRVVFATHEPDARRVYVGTFDKECVHDSYVTLFMEADRNRRYIIPVPRAYLVMWEQQATGDALRERLLMTGGYMDVLTALERSAVAGGRAVR